jgi:predicted dehydrogenase
VINHPTNRRHFLKAAAATGIGYWVAGGVQAQESTSPNEQIAIANIGIGGKGSSDLTESSREGRIVALCDVDEKRLELAGKKFPEAKTYTDFRKMLDEMGDSIDAVTVSTPDHTHAAAALKAMRMGKHCFCQKPLTHSIYEARLMAKVAKENNVATQMGNQFTASSGARRAAAQVRSGVLGPVKEIHVWTDRPIWPQGGERPEPKTPPEHLKWDLWLGPAPRRPYANGYHPFSWRGWWDFGTGALGDMACHTLNMPYMALDLRDPISVQAVTSGHNRDSYPAWSIITYEFPANGDRPAVKMTWYDGGKRVPREVLGDVEPETSGSAIVGEKAIMYAPGDYAHEKIEILGDVDVPEVDFPESPGHVQEWARAIRGGEPAMSNFPNYAGRLTETVLLGNLAVWTANEGEGPKVEWDAENLKSTNISGLEPIIKPTYRDGYTLDA